MANKRAPRRDVEVDLVRTIYWYRTLCDYFGDERPRAIQRLVDPISMRTDSDGQPIRNNKFKSYAEGKHVPSAALVQSAKMLVKDSERALNHVVWQILRERGPIREKANEWARHLSPDIQAIVFGPGFELTLRGDRHFLSSLERREGMDGLAILTILFKLSMEDEDNEQAWTIAHSIFRVLLMVGPALDEKTIAEQVFSLYVKRVFSLVSFNGFVIDLDNYRYIETASIVGFLASRLQTQQGNYRQRKFPSYYPLQVINGLRGNMGQTFTLPVRNA